MVFQVFFVILLSGFLGEAESQSGIEIVRLTGGKKPSEGTVEIYFEKEWRPVSYDGFSNMSARILCYALGYNSSRVLYSLNSFYKNTTKRTVMFECWWTLKVTDMKYCVKTDGGEYNRRVAGVDCDPEEFHDVDIRLTHGEYPIVGQLEVKVKGQWGGVCDPGTKDRTAKVACRQLGHSGAMALAIKPWPYKSSVEYLMGSPECDGTETNLGTCKARPWGDTDCKGNRPYYGLGVACLTDNDIHESFQVKIGDYRVYGSETKHPDAGLLLVNVAGVWGTVCKYSLDLKTVTFFCRQASYQWGKVINKVGCYNEIFQHIWFKRITCSGDESYVTECREIEWTPHSCYENKVAVVQCYNDSLPSKPFIEILTPGPMIEGKPMKLRCTSQGERPIYLRWYCDPYYGLGDQSGNDTHISTVITLHRLTMYYNYNRYCSCTVNNDDGWSDSSSLNYKVNFGPYYRYEYYPAITSPSNIEVGQVVNVTCTFGKSRPRPEVFWYFDDVLMRDLNPTTSFKHDWKYDSYYTVSTITFTFKRSYNGTRVHCVAWNNVTEKWQHHRTTLKMKEPVGALMAKAEIIYTGIEPKLKFLCEMPGVPDAKPIWVSDKGTVVSPLPVFSLAIQNNDYRTYKCQVKTHKDIISAEPVFLNDEEDFSVFWTSSPMRRKREYFPYYGIMKLRGSQRPSAVCRKYVRRGSQRELDRNPTATANELFQG